jgi:adenine deaminase
MKTVLRLQYADIVAQQVYAAEVTIAHGIIETITPIQAPASEEWPVMAPGFVDAHVHIESSMLIPSEFARLAVVHGTVATVSDPHEIANVCGAEGVRFMLADGKRVPFKFYFGAPSCVPATIFETAGATLDVEEVSALLALPEVKYLSEMMNFPGVLHHDETVMAKIEAAKNAGKPIDGHAPGLRGEALARYIAAGISTDHECFTAEEALEKLQLGMQVIIREGSAARNFEALAPLLHQWHHRMMFCSDDKHPDSLLDGHINTLCARAVALGVPWYKVLQVACINPVKHYALPVGLARAGQQADFVLLKDLVSFEVLSTYINGQLVAHKGQSLINPHPAAGESHINNCTCSPVAAADFELPINGNAEMQVIEAYDGQLITGKYWWKPAVDKGVVVPDVAADVLKIAVINRYKKAPVAVAFIKNIGLKKGAIASSVAHDSHNIVVVGCSDDCMARAANLVIAHRGGVSATDGTGTDHVLGLPVAGLMSAQDGYAVAEAYTAIDHFSKTALGSTLQAPFMTLSFMALLVIPHLKLSDLGLFDGDNFAFVR